MIKKIWNKFKSLLQNNLFFYSAISLMVLFIIVGITFGLFAERYSTKPQTADFTNKEISFDGSDKTPKKSAKKSSPQVKSSQSIQSTQSNSQYISALQNKRNKLVNRIAQLEAQKANIPKSLLPEHQKKLAEIEVWYAENKDLEECWDCGPQGSCCHIIGPTLYQKMLQEENKRYNREIDSAIFKINTPISMNKSLLAEINRILNDINSFMSSYIQQKLDSHIF